MNIKKNWKQLFYLHFMYMKLQEKKITTFLGREEYQDDVKEFELNFFDKGQK